MHEATNFMNLEIPVGYVAAGLLALFVTYQAGAKALGGIKSMASNFQPGNVAALVMFVTGILGIGYSTGDMVARCDGDPAVTADATAQVEWLSNDEFLSLADADEDNVRLLLQAHKAQNKEQREFFAKVEDQKAKQAEAAEKEELRLMPTSVSTPSSESVAPVDFTLLGADDPTIDAQPEDGPVLDQPQLPIQGTVAILAAGLALLICGVVTFIRQQDDSK